MGSRVFVAVRTVIYICGFMVVLLWLVPRWIGIRTSIESPSVAPLRWLGLIPLTVGANIAVYCFVHFVASGRGTPAPFDAPRRLVASGPYRYVRNPMYVGTGLFIAGCAILFWEFSLALLWYGLAIAVAVNLFILLYEEPTLRRKFDGDYREYCRNVRRWIPRTRPWQPGRHARLRLEVSSWNGTPRVKIEHGGHGGHGGLLLDLLRNRELTWVEPIETYSRNRTIQHCSVFLRALRVQSLRTPGRGRSAPGKEKSAE